MPLFRFRSPWFCEFLHDYEYSPLQAKKDSMNRSAPLRDGPLPLKNWATGEAGCLVRAYVDCSKSVGDRSPRHVRTLPIRLSPTPTICSVHPFS